MQYAQILDHHHGFAVRQAQRFFTRDLGPHQREDLIQAAIEGLLVAAAEVDWRHVNAQRNPTAFFLTIARRRITPLLVAQASQNRPTSLGCGCGAAVCERCRAKAASDARRRAADEQLPRRSYRGDVLDALEHATTLHAADGALRVDPADTHGLAPGEADENDLLDEIYGLIDDLADGRDRDVLRMAYCDGLDDDAIADRLDVSARTVRRLRTSATDQVRALLIAQQNI